MSTKNLSDRLRYLVKDEDQVYGSDEFWVVIYMGDDIYLAAWVDENGEVKTAEYKTANGAIKRADRSWGC